MPKITPFLWFDNNAQDAIDFYKSIFKSFKLLDISYLEDTGPDRNQKVMTATFEIEGQRFMVLNGGPMFKFTEAISFFIDCKDQEEVDYYWEKLTEGGEESQCGWLKDKFGISWQVIPSELGKLLGDKDQEKAKRAMNAMLDMHKIEISKLQEAFKG